MDWTRGGDDWLAEVEQLRRDEGAQEYHDAYHAPGYWDEECWYCRPMIVEDLEDRIAFLENELAERRAKLADMEA